MKIFNWVHRKLNHKDGSSSENAKKGSGIANVDNAQLPAEENGLGEVFGDWKGGILTIGTFGYHLLKDEDNTDEENGLRFEEEEEKEIADGEMIVSDEEENEGVKPLVYADYNAHDYKGLLEMKMDETIVLKSESEIEADHDDIVKLRERITLADLFSADSEETLKKKQFTTHKGGDLDDDEIAVKDEKVKINDDENHGSFPKKLTKGDAARPTHKLNRLIRRMLKRKIHPADPGRLNKLGDINQNNSNVRADKCGTTETASVFPIQDAII